MDYQELFKQINKLGYSMSSTSEILEIGKNDKQLVPILIQWLKKAKRKQDKDLLVRALGVKGFYEATNVLIEEYLKSDNQMYKWAIGNSLYNIQDKSSSDKLLEIIKDNSHGASRQMIIIALGKMKIELAIPIFLKLLEEGQEVGHVISALGYYDMPGLIKYIKPFLKHEKKWIKKEAAKTIKKLEKIL